MKWHFRIKIFMLAIILMLLFVDKLWAASVEFTWVANTESDLAGYRLFQRNQNESYDYTSPIAEISIGTEIYLLENVADGNWAWTLRAFDTSGNESGNSNECFLDSLPPSIVQGFG